MFTHLGHNSDIAQHSNRLLTELIAVTKATHNGFAKIHGRAFFPEVPTPFADAGFQLGPSGQRLEEARAIIVRRSDAGKRLTVADQSETMLRQGCKV